LAIKNNEIIPYAHPASSFSYDIPPSEEGQYKNTITSIKNAWNNSTYLDNSGKAWVDTENLHSILRTNKSNANYIVAKISDENKVTFNNKTFIRGYEISMRIDKLIQECGSGTKVDYLKYSEKNYISIRDCDKGKLLRSESENRLSEERKKLKKKRIKCYKIKKDELTGGALDIKNSDFSHIRSYSLYPLLADNIKNGLIVNKSTHKIITEENISDEDELYALCKKKGWTTNWYDKFQESFINI